MGKSQPTEIEISSDLDFRSPQRVAEQIQAGKDEQYSGDNPFIKKERHDGGQKRSCRPQSHVQEKMCGGEFVNVVVFVEQGQVEAQVAEADDHGHHDRGQFNVSELSWIEQAQQQDSSNPVDQAGHVGAANGLECAARDSVHRRVLLRHWGSLSTWGKRRQCR